VYKVISKLFLCKAFCVDIVTLISEHVYIVYRYLPVQFYAVQYTVFTSQLVSVSLQCMSFDKPHLVDDANKYLFVSASFQCKELFVNFNFISVNRFTVYNFC
jgi:hypothetical protein